MDDAVAIRIAPDDLSFYYLTTDLGRERASAALKHNAYWNWGGTERVTKATFGASGSEESVVRYTELLCLPRR